MNANAHLIIELFLIRCMGLVGVEEIWKIRLQVSDFELQIPKFYRSQWNTILMNF